MTGPRCTVTAPCTSAIQRRARGIALLTRMSFYVAKERSSSNTARCCTLFKLLFMDIVHGHYSPLEKKNDLRDLGRHKINNDRTLLQPKYQTN